MLTSLSSDNASFPDESVKDVGTATFKADVLEASRGALVLAVFGTPRDSVCVQMTAALEKIARTSKGAVRLAKIDIDQDLALAQQLGVRSAPSVFAFHQARPVDGFAGSVQESQIKSWVEQLVKTTGAKEAEQPGLKMAFQQASDYLSDGDIDTARAIYVDVLEMEPENAEAYAGLIRCFVQEGEIGKAREMLDGAPPAMAAHKALEPVRAAIELAEQGEQSKGQVQALEAAIVQNSADYQARFDLAVAYFALGRKEEAVDHLLEIVKRARSWNEDAARKQLVKFFEAMGATDPLTLSARRRLSSILFA
jgi:putative thioredoxin